MSLRCWQCSEELDTSSVERQIYQSVIEHLRGKLCENAKDDLKCDLWWRHEDCHMLGVLIQELKEKL
jgi:hypothetical protein